MHTGRYVYAVSFLVPGMMTHPMAVDGEKSGYGLVDAVAGILSGSLDSGSEASDLSSLSHEADITAVDKDEKSGE